MLTLYDFRPSGNGYKVRLILKHLGIPYDYVDTDILKGETRTAAFLAMNPNGKIPTLDFGDGRVLSESNAILLHFADGTAFLPGDPWEKSKVHEWLFFEQYSHEPNIASPRFWLHYLEPGQYDETELRKRQKAGRAALQIMEDYLTENAFFGPNYGVADIALYAYTHKADEGGQKLADFPAITAWFERVCAQPGHAPIEEK